MKTLQFYIGVGAILLMLLLPVSCSKESSQSDKKPVVGSRVKFTAITEATKATISEDWKNIFWQEGDKISVLDGVSNVAYTTSQSGSEVTFVSEVGIANATEAVYSVFPYDESAMLVEGSSLRITLPARQNVPSGAYVDPDALVAVAYSKEVEENTILQFRNISAFLKFTVPSADNVTDIVFEAGEGEFLAGTIDVSFSTKGEVSFNVVEGAGTVQFHSEDTMDGTYLVPLLPGVLQNGLRVTLKTSDGRTAIHRIVARDEQGVESAVSLRRGKVNYYTANFSNPVWRSAPEIALVEASSTTATIRWSESGFTSPQEDISAAYKVYLFADADCTDTLYAGSWQNTASWGGYPSFLFTGLTPETSYWAKVEDEETGVSSGPFEFTTDAMSGPDVTVGTVFWSDALISWVYGGEAAGYKVYVAGEEVAVLDASATQYHVTGLESGKSYDIVVAALDSEGHEGRSLVKTITTGSVTRITKNLSPTSLSFAIENRAGDNTGNNNPLIEVELLDGPNPASANSIFRSYVLDAQILSPGTPYFASLSVNEKKDRAPLNVAVGCLEPGTDYWFRLRSVESLTFTSYQKSTPASQTVTSSKGTSEFSLPVKATTPAVHTPETGEVLFEGFDCLMIQADYVNLAVGSMPAYKKAGKAANAMSYKTIKEWAGDWSFYGLRNAYGSTQLAPQYAWATQQTADNEMFSLSAQNSNGTIKGTAGTVPGIGAKIYAFKESSDVSGSLAGWLSTNSTYACQGYIQLGAYYNESDAVNNLLGMIVTPELTQNLGAEAQACTLSFKGLVIQGRDCALGIWKYSGGAWTKLADVALFNSAGSRSVADVWSGEADTHRWYSHSLDVELKVGDRIALEAPKAAGAALIDEICITKK